MNESKLICLKKALREISYLDELMYQQGELATDTIHFTPDANIQHHLFTQITNQQTKTSCGLGEGIMGLAFTKLSNQLYPSLVHNMELALKNPIFSIYFNLNKRHDSLSISINTIKDSNKPCISKTKHRNSISMHSQLIIGGVNNKFYEGCPNWHDLYDQTYTMANIMPTF